MMFFFFLPLKLIITRFLFKLIVKEKRRWTMSTLNPFTFSTTIQGVQVKPMTQDGKAIRIRYIGRLSQSGANQVWMHAGTGDHEDWSDSKDYIMEKTNDGWEQTVDVQGSQFNFCFRDDAKNWDNNNGSNWIYRIT